VRLLDFEIEGRVRRRSTGCPISVELADRHTDRTGASSRACRRREASCCAVPSDSSRRGVRENPRMARVCP
jgi:hypothetical protein